MGCGSEICLPDTTVLCISVVDGYWICLSSLVDQNITLISCFTCNTTCCKEVAGDGEGTLSGTGMAITDDAVNT